MKIIGVEKVWKFEREEKMAGENIKLYSVGLPNSYEQCRLCVSGL